MKIDNLKINGYGKLSNKEIQLKSGINIIHGDNETGKSTLLNFIYSMFFGASKNKNGKDMSDFDKYKPWVGEDFSGKTKYILDDGKEYEIFRDFNKKNPQIYNSNLENISDNFNIDKTKGNQFFLEQTGIDENLFLTTMTVCQDEVVLDNSKQNVLLQKITNMISSGEDNVSYKKTIEKLNKKMLEEIGTSRSTERPINVIEDEIKSLEMEKNELELYKFKVQNAEEQKAEIKMQLESTKTKLSILKEIQEYKQKEFLEEQKIGINSKKLNEYNEKLSNLKNSKEQTGKVNKKHVNPIVILVIWILIVLTLAIAVKNVFITAGATALGGLGFLYNLRIYNKYKRQMNKQNEEKIKYEKELELLQISINQCSDEIEQDRKSIEKKQTEEINYIINKYGKQSDADEYVLLSAEEISEKIEHNQKIYNEIIVKENTLEIEKQTQYEKLENAVKQEERLQYLYEQQKELKDLANCITLAQLGIEEAYTIMKKTITPKFTNELTEIIQDITGGKYKNIRFNDTEGLLVELENGEYINCNRLSIGTIDQMHLALRLSILNEISKETMPIILDEPFVYYDENRLKNILMYIANKYSNRQIIILTCTDREIKTLDNLNIEYKLINL